MLKKQIAALLAAALLLCCFTVGAAAELFNEDWSDLSFTMTDLPSGETVSFRGDCGIPTVLLFGGIGTCYNTNSFIQSMFDLSDLFPAGALQVFWFDLRGITKEDVDYVFEEVEIPQGYYVGVQESIRPASPLPRLLRQLNGSDSYAFTMPAVAFLDANGRVREITTGAVTKQSILASLKRIGVETAYKTAVDVVLRGTFRQSEAREELQMVNDLRANNAWYWNADNKTKTERDDLAPLVYDYALEKVAMQRATELALRFSHTRPDGGSFWEAYAEQGYAYSACGENIAYGYRSARSVQVAWEEEQDPYEGQGHRRNMLNAGFRAFGCACFEYDGILFWVQEFSGNVVSAAAVPANDAETAGRVSIPVSTVAGWSASPEALELQVGESLSPDSRITLSLETSDETLESAETPEWTSADSGILTANANGTFTAKAEGKTTLTATLPAYNGNRTVSVQVTVRGSASYLPDKLAFDAYKAKAAKTADAAAKADDSETSAGLIAAAKAALAGLVYDANKTPAQNNAAVDAILSKLTKDLAAQRNADRLESDKAAFEEKKAEMKANADAMARPGDSAACAALIREAKAAIDKTAYDESLSLADNIGSANEILLHLRAALRQQREASSPKRGDVDGDGTADAGDARLALRASVGLEPYQKGDAAFTAADVDGNGVIEASDARLILRASVGLEDLDK